MRSVTNALTKAREGLRHMNGCFRWTGDGRCIDCRRYTGIPSAVVEVTVGGVVHYYDRQAAERHGLRPSGVSVGGMQPLAPAPPSAAATGSVVKPISEQDFVRRDGARFGGAEPITERDLVRRGTLAAVAQPPAPVPGDAAVLVQPVIQPTQKAPPPQETAAAQQPPSPDVVHAAVPPDRLETRGPDPERDAGQDNGPAEFLVNLKRARQHLALAAQQPKPRAKRKK